MKKRIAGLYYNQSFLSSKDREEILAWLATLYPIWEYRDPEKTRRLLRPVYWLGNWQFACLDYYHPPKGILHRCVQAEPFPPVLARLVRKIELTAQKIFLPHEIPKGWHLNTCLLNYYGSSIENGKRVDNARVGEHKDFEPGPVGSISLGERAMFQFVDQSSKVVLEQWLDDGSLQIFGGRRWKEQLFHRVQRVDTKGGYHFPIHVENFETRRLNFTFRYVPDEHIVPYKALPATAKENVLGYMRELAQHSSFFAKAIK